MSKQVVVVGSINMDLVVRSERIPAPGETVHGLSFSEYPGGKGANQAVGVAKLGHPVAMIGKLGNDAFGRTLRQSLDRSGVDTAGVEEIAGPSGLAVISTDSHAQNSIVVVPGANGQLFPEDLDRHRGLISGAGIVLTQLEIPFETVVRLAEICARYAVPLMLDPAPARNLSASLMARISWITPNETEAPILLEDSTARPDFSFRDAADRLVALGPQNALIKCGGQGCVFASKSGEKFAFPAFEVQALDTTAAGDAFNSGLAVGLMRGLNSQQAIRLASAVAAISVTRYGAQPSMPTASEADDLFLNGDTSNSV